MLVDNIEEAYRSLAQDEVDAVVFDAPVLRFHAAPGLGPWLRKQLHKLRFVPLASL